MSFSLDKPESILYLKASDVNDEVLYSMFAVLGKDTKVAALPSNTKVTITKELLEDSQSALRLCRNVKELYGMETTVGRILTYQFLYDIPFEFSDIDPKTNKPTNTKTGNVMQFVDFVNNGLTKKRLGGLDQLVADALVDGYINYVAMNIYIDRSQWLGYTVANFALPSLDIRTVNPSKTIKNYRDKALKDNKEAIDNCDLKQFSKMEKEVLDFAGAQLDKEGATGKLIYDSGFNGDFGNNYKVTSIFRGIAPKSDNLNSFEIVQSNLNDGVAKKDIPAHADLGVLGAAGRAKDTQLAGYKTKIFNAAFGAITAGKAGTDCKSKLTITQTINESNYRFYRYRTIVEKDGTLVTIDDSNKKSYFGKSVQLRSPLYCHNDQICSACLGQMSYKLKIRNIGLHVARITTKLMNLSMKAFHNMAVEPKAYDLLDYITKSKD